MKNDHELFDAIPKLAMPSTPARKKELYVTPGAESGVHSEAVTPTPNTSR
jgi:hypothetical protein